MVPRRGVEYAEDIRALRGLAEDEAADAEGHLGITVAQAEWSRDP